MVDTVDLIDLHVGSPSPPIPQPNEEIPSLNLIDSELPLFDQNLQTTPFTPPKPIADVEEILITIDDYEEPQAHFSRTASFRRSKSETCLPHARDKTLDKDKSWSCEDLEAFIVLQDLEDLLDASLIESDDDIAQEAVEKCLVDLDNYLRECERSDEQEEAELRRKLRQAEENYARFVARGRGRNKDPLGRPKSAEGDRGESVKILGWNTVAVGRRQMRSPPPSPPDSDSEIDWSWLTTEAARSVPEERRAHAAASAATGSVTVEAVPVAKEPIGWQRSSMRRLRHLPLPEQQAELAQATPPVATARPMSAPSRLSVGTAPGGGSTRSMASTVSSMASTVDTTPSGTTAPTPVGGGPEVQEQRRQCDRPPAPPPSMPSCESPLGHWPHSLSSMMACLGCTLGLFNVSRFAILTVHFGANFIFQFLLLSAVFGLPLFTLLLCLGQQLGAGVVDMWRISPLFQGVGVALLLGQALLGLYSVVGVSWMFVFFRDSFITKVDRYRWAEPVLYYREGFQSLTNGTYKLSETVPDYFSGVVLQRHHLASGNSYGAIKFQLAFNLAVVWMIVFVSLSKGLRSYGKVIYIFTLLPVFGMFILCAKILGMMPTEYINIIFPETSWNEFFLNPKSWLAAAQETFLTWGILGTAVMQIASHNKHKHLLQRDSSLVAVITITILLLAAFLANTCVQILKSYNYLYLPDSFERISSYTFLRHERDVLPVTLSNTPVRYMVHNSFFLGEKVVRPGADNTVESGYQAVRLASELIPATFAVLGADQLSPFWAVLFYFILILFGIAQQLAIWHCVITGIIAIKAELLKSWETTITLFSCICGFILGLPMATEFGLYVVYFMDYTIGGIWWLLIIFLFLIIAVFMVRGRPYSGDTVVTALFNSNNHPCVMSWAPALLSFNWNVILPVALMVLCISTFKNGNYREMFIWHHAPIAEYWPLWTRQLGSMLQLIPILLVPLVAVIQSYRYLNNGPADILERIQLLYRPPIGEHMTDLIVHNTITTNQNTTPAPAAPSEDPPPKYTPPPSYTTATGARIAKFLRQSIRRSVRRLANVLGEGGSRTQGHASSSVQAPPPDYSAVLVEMNQTTRAEVVVNTPETGAAGSAPFGSTLERLRNLRVTPGSPTLTAAEVASILRSSFRRSHARTRVGNEEGLGSLSAENLVDSAAPIGETSLVVEEDKEGANTSVI